MLSAHAHNKGCEFASREALNTTTFCSSTSTETTPSTKPIKKDNGRNASNSPGSNTCASSIYFSTREPERTPLAPQQLASKVLPEKIQQRLCRALPPSTTLETRELERVTNQLLEPRESETTQGKTKVSITPIKTLAASSYRATVGVVLLDCDETAEDALRRMLPKNIGMYISRVAKGDSLTAEALRSTASRIPEGASLIIPGRPLDSIIFACTSASALLGEERVNALLSKGRPGPKPSTLMAAVVRALKFLGAKRVGLATPYLAEITQEQARVMEERGFSIPAARCLGLNKDSEVGLVTADDIKQLGRDTYKDCLDVDGQPPQAIFLSCSQLRAADVIEELEEELEIPIVTSNQAMMWELLRLANVDDQVADFGSLLSTSDRSLWRNAE